MPIHDYKCTNESCGYTLEEVQAEYAPQLCPTCKSVMIIKWSSVKPGFTVKGFNAKNGYSSRGKK